MEVRPDPEYLMAERDFDSIFTYTAGIVRSKFLTELRDNENIVGTKCSDCNTVWVPARSTCVKCFASLSNFVDVGKSGTLTTYSVIHRSQEIYPMETPFILGIIKLDGADTGLVHFINEISPEDVKIGMEVEAVFSEERTGSISDIKYFRPVRA
ncbi:Zn-ribbon domain-containing OB-fold protein [Thermodesulfobacteriota bacterium]